MFYCLFIVIVVGIFVVFVVVGFCYVMLLLEWLFFNNDFGSLVNAVINFFFW